MKRNREVWQELHGPLPKGYVVHHLNGNTQDCRAENLAAVPRTPEHMGQVTAPYTERIKNLERLLKKVIGENSDY